MTEKRHGNENNEGVCYGVIPVSFTCHPRENGDPGIIYSRFPPARE
ncbi:MAG: hypothetical protein SFT93_00285 [Rickettsiaceae bacterium]|nr:hypothetical protein [Rickettsiaceae bacterium]